VTKTSEFFRFVIKQSISIYFSFIDRLLFSYSLQHFQICGRASYLKHSSWRGLVYFFLLLDPIHDVIKLKIKLFGEHQRLFQFY
jgi:hypothetical protein